jgi:hypothetical protein
MNLKRAALTVLSASVVLLAGLVMVPSQAVASPAAKNLWVNSQGTVSATGPHNSCTAPGFTAIQAAIDVASPGATIHVCSNSGTPAYAEQLVITEPLNIVAAGTDATVALPATVANGTTACDLASVAGGAEPDQSEITVCTTGTIRISGITVDALWPGGTCYDSLFGVLVGGGANLDMSTSVVNGAGASPINGCQGGIGVQVGMAWADPTVVGHATLSGDSIDQFQKNGITVDGVGSTATITGTTITGAGPTPAIAQNGIQISNGARGQITNTTVSGSECDVPVCGPDSLTDTQSTGILFFGAAPGTTVTHSAISDSDIGVYSYDLAATAPSTPNATISDDTLTNDRYEAIGLDQGFTVVSNDTLSGGNVGVQVLQYYGQAYGVTAKVKNVTVSGMAVAAAQVYSDENPADFAGSLSITHSKISGNPGSITASVLDNSPAAAAYSVTLKKDS